MNHWQRMKAVVYKKYGQPDVLELREIEKPKPAPGEVLVRVYSVSLNASDMELLTGTPLYSRMWGLWAPKKQILGSDIAGIVEKTGKGVSQLNVGDQVMGDAIGHWGGLAEHVCLPESVLVKKPSSISFDEASTLPQAGSIALQGILDKGKVREGQHVLINGAGGGSGTFAIQLAKLQGAKVTGVDNAKKLDTMLESGVDHAIDYEKEDFTETGRRYDLILDLVARRSIFAYRGAMHPQGKYMMVGGSMGTMFQILFLGTVISALSSRKTSILGVRQNQQSLLRVIELFEARKIVPRMDQIFTLDQTPDAMRYMIEGRAKGKIVIKVFSGS